jgi:hypothetical protein
LVKRKRLIVNMYIICKTSWVQISLKADWLSGQKLCKAKFNYCTVQWSSQSPVHTIIISHGNKRGKTCIPCLHLSSNSFNKVFFFMIFFSRLQTAKYLRTKSITTKNTKLKGFTKSGNKQWILSVFMLKYDGWLHGFLLFASH